MPIYESEKVSRGKLNELRKRNRCKVCRGPLALFFDNEDGLAFLACMDYLRTYHEGIEREASRYEQEGLAALNIESRREIMTRELGERRIQALAKYEGVLSLSKQMAGEILESLWPEAPVAEKARAALLCATQQLNPLMKHVFLIPFNKGKKSETWATVLGIKAKRLMASRRGTFSYVDDTPRIMTEEEQMKRFGRVKNDKLVVIVKLRDPATGAEAPGYGDWPLMKKDYDENQRKYVEKDNIPYGSDKGNDMFNMAAIHAESQALDRLRPGEMPQNIAVMDEAYAEEASEKGTDENVIEGEGRVIEDDSFDSLESAATPAMATKEQLTKIDELKKAGKDLKNQIKEFGWNITKPSELTFEQANQLIEINKPFEVGSKGEEGKLL